MSSDLKKLIKAALGKGVSSITIVTFAILLNQHESDLWNSVIAKIAYASIAATISRIGLDNVALTNIRQNGDYSVIILQFLIHLLFIGVGYALIYLFFDTNYYLVLILASCFSLCTMLSTILIGKKNMIIGVTARSMPVYCALILIWTIPDASTVIITAFLGVLNIVLFICVCLLLNTSCPKNIRLSQLANVSELKDLYPAFLFAVLITFLTNLPILLSDWSFVELQITEANLLQRLLGIGGSLSAVFFWAIPYFGTLKLQRALIILMICTLLIIPLLAQQSLIFVYGATIGFWTISSYMRNKLIEAQRYKTLSYEVFFVIFIMIVMSNFMSVYYSIMMAALLSSVHNHIRQGVELDYHR